jgi:hypothetical protein
MAVLPQQQPFGAALYFTRLMSLRVDRRRTDGSSNLLPDRPMLTGYRRLFEQLIAAANQAASDNGG